jgi:4-alpha-glucanotransferase
VDESLEETAGSRVVDPALVGARHAGVLLHPTALPGGRIGPAAREFVDWLAEAGQRWWQILPLGPPDEHRSPYAARSAFAGWPGLLADPDAPVAPEEVAAFRERHAFWAEGWERVAGPDALADQVRFEREWSALRRHAAERGVRILGDVPLYVAAGSADALTWPELFAERDVAGAPPDDYSAVGQLWGNPLHDWRAHADSGYEWWIQRIARTLDLVDAARIDHFRGFVSYWAVPEGAADARSGRWRRGPGGAPLVAAAERLGPLPLIAEDLGVITPAVDTLRDRLGLPGMRVIQFGFGGGADNPHRLAHHPRESVAYTGTHDNPTIAEWWAAADEHVRAAVDATAAEAGIDEPEPHRRLVRLALSSRAALAVVPAQDLLGLGAEGRFNTPGTAHGNWEWRLEPGALDARLARWLREATEEAGRAEPA